MTLRCTVGAVVAVCALATPQAVEAGWKDWLKSVGDAVGASKDASSPSQTSLAQREIVAGLKEALGVGVQRAIEHLGRAGGFLDDSAVKIPLPANLRKLETGLRAVGQGALADEFVTTMNRAAESAVPKTASIFVNTIKGMSLEDAKGILYGADDAASRYFRERSGDQLSQAILPIVEDATARTGVTSAYKKLTSGVGLLGQLRDGAGLDIDHYVTEKTLDGLFLKLAEEEMRIRQDPAARSTELLKKVFATTLR